MKALIWKELRQLMLWGSLLLLAVTGLIVAILYTGFDHNPYQFPTKDLPATMILCAGGAALVLGLLQTILEVRRDQWAFLIHRGTPASQIFRAKVIAAAIYYGVIVLVPLVISIVWIRRGGIDHYPFTWALMVPTLSVIVASFGFYFAGVAAVVWKGPWYISRLFPPTMACLGVFIVAVTYSGFTEYVPVSVFVVAAVLIAIIAFAARGLFVRSGESTRRSRSVNICLGIVSFCGVQGALICLLYAVGGLLSLLLDSPRSLSAESSTLIVNREGHVCRMTTIPTDSYDSMIESVTDLDEPQSRKYASMVGRSLRGAQTGKYPEWDQVNTNPAVQGNRGVERQILSQIANTGLMNEQGQVVVPKISRESDPATGRRFLGSPVQWVFSRSDGWIYGYAEEYEQQEGRAIRLQPRLVGIVGPDEFVEPSQRPKSRFNHVWPMTYDSRYVGTYQSDGTVNLPSQFYAESEAGLFEINLYKRRCRRLFAPPEGQISREFVTLDDGFALVSDKSIQVYSAPQKTKNKESVSIAYALENATLQQTFIIPEAVLKGDYFSFGWIPKLNQLVYSHYEPHEYVFARPDGTIARLYPMDNTPLHAQPSFIPILATVVSFLPAGPMAIVLTVDAIMHNWSSDWPGSVGMLWKESHVGAVVILLMLIISPACCWWFARRTASHYGFNKRTGRIWQGMAIFLGPGSLLTMWFLRDWSVRVPCRGCGKLRPVDRDSCPQCGVQFASPESNGTEIFTKPRQPVAQPA